MNQSSTDPDSVLTPDVDPTAQPESREAGAPLPDLSRTVAVASSRRVESVGITILAVLATIYTLYFARELLRPIVFALLLSFLFSPVVRALARLRIRPPIGAAMVVLTLLGTAAFGVYELSGPVQSWAATAPETLAATRGKLRTVLKPLERVTHTAEQVENAASTTAVVGSGPAPREVVVRGPSLVARAFGTTQRFFTSTLEIMLLLYFLLAGGDLFLQKLVKVLPTIGDKRKAVEIARATEASISTYLLATAVVNVSEGLVVAVAMYLLGMPNPALWGALVALLEFIPYLGALVMVGVLTIAAITTFDGVGQALLVPAVFLVINLIQANLVSPLLVGHRLALNPVALLVGLAFWFRIWGVPGAFIAVPLLATFKIICDRVESLAAFGEFLGMRDERERRATLR